MKNCLEYYILPIRAMTCYSLGKYVIQTECISNVLVLMRPLQDFEENTQKIPLCQILLTPDYKCYTQTRFLTCCSKITDLTSRIPVVVSFDVPGQDFAFKYFLIFKCLHAKSSTVGMFSTVPTLPNFTFNNCNELYC